MTRLATPGLCSVTFRALAPADLIALAAENGVEAIEWGGDVHVPPGDIKAAADIAARCADAGIACPSLGSYLRAGDADLREDFGKVLYTATALGAGNIRVWAGRMAGGQADADTWAKVRDDLVFMAERAASSGLTISVEYHRGTLTEDAPDAARLLADCDHPNLFTYWQPVPGRGTTAWLAEIDQLSPWLGWFHVFHWTPSKPHDTRLPLTEGQQYWADLFDAWRTAPHWPHGRTAFLEFVKDDDTAIFKEDMRVLTRLCRGKPQPVARTG